MTTGLGDILKNLSLADRGAGVKGVQSGVLLIKAEAQKITPVDKGILVAGVHTDVYENGDIVTGEVYYTADYAPYVHEMPADTNWQKPTAENKFLEKALTRNEKAVITLMNGSIGID